MRYNSLFIIALVFGLIGFSSTLEAQSLTENLDKVFHEYKVQHINSNAIMTNVNKGGFVNVTLPSAIEGESYDLELVPSNIISENYISRAATDEGVIFREPNLPHPMYGNIKGDYQSSVSLTFNDGFIYGFIKDKNGYQFIEPASHYDSSVRNTDMYVIYKASDVKDDAPKTCGTTDMHKVQNHLNHQVEHAPRDSRSVGECLEVEYAIANDFLMYQHFGNSLGAVENHAIGVTNNIQTNYDDEFGDELQFVIVEQFTATSNSSDPWSSTTVAGDFLDDFSLWGPTGFVAVHDVGSIWTDRDFNGSTIGIAWLSAICESFGEYGRYNALQNWSSNANLKRVMVAHELGHNFGSNHDAEGSPTIMAPAVNNTTTWSQQSINAVDAHVATRWCLDVCSGSSIPPTADFSFNIIEDCTVGEVVFTNASTGSNNSYSWTFEGGVPATSTDENPSIFYPDAGTFDVTLLVTNSAGSDEMVMNNAITITPSPIPNFAYSVDGAIVSFFNVSDFATQYEWDFGDGNTSILTDPVHNYFDDGSYEVTLTAISECGEEITTQTIVIATPPSANAMAETTEGCAALEVQFHANASPNTDDFSWIFPGGTPNTSTDPDPIVTYADGGTFDVTLTVSNEQGDELYELEDYITVNEGPNADFTFEVDGDEVSFSDISIDADTHHWNFGDGETSTEPNPVHTYAMDGDYNVVLTVTNECGTDMFFQDVEIVTGVNAVFSFIVVDDLCTPSVVDFVNESSDEATEILWLFEGGSPASSTVDNPTVTYNDAGSFDVTLIVGNENGMDTAEMEDVIVVNSGPNSGFNFSLDGLAVDFDNNSQGATTYTWDFGDGNTSMQENPTHNYTNEGIYLVSLTATNECGSDVITQELNNYTPVMADLSSDVESGCADLLVSFSDESSSNVESWEWEFPGGNPATSTAQNPEVTYSEAGSYDVILTVSHAESSETIILTDYIVVNDAPQTSFEYFDDLFEVTFSNNTLSGVTYSWDFGDGNTSTEESPTHTFTEEGSYEVSLTATNACGTTSFTETIEINALPTAGFSSDVTSGCLPLTVTLQNQSSSNATGFNWTIEGGSPGTSTDENPTVTFNNAGTYDVTLEVSSPAGNDIITLEDYITVLDVPTAEISYDLDGNLLTATNVGSDGVSVSWDVIGQTIDEEVLNVEFAENAAYLLSLTVTNECGTATAQEEIIVNVYPEIDFNTLPVVICEDESFTFSDNTQNGESWLWTFEGGSVETSSEQNPTVVFDEAGNYDFSLEVSNGFGTASMTFEDGIQVNPLPTASFTVDQNQNTVSFESSVSDATELLWDFGDGNTSDEENPIHTYDETGTYTVSLTVGNNCGNVSIINEIQISTVGITESQFDELVIAPNPARELITISLDNVKNEDIKMSIIDMSGKSVRELTFNSSVYTIDVSDITEGTYIVRFISDDVSILRKIVVLK